MEFNDVRAQYSALSTEIDAAAGRVFAGGRYILGESVAQFEDDFARYCGAECGVGTGSGTDALKIALAALGVRAGDEVLVPAVSAPATATAVAELGARPVFVDIRSDDFTMDPADAFEKRSSRTKAVVPVHLYGMPAHLKELAGMRLPVVEDAAQAHGSEAVWGRCGSFGAAAAFSFYPTKNLGAYGDGGMIVTSDAGIAARARMLRNYGQRENYRAARRGYNSRLDELHAAILRVKLKSLDEWNGRRREIAAAYRAAFEALPVGLQAETGKSNYHLFVITTPRRDALLRRLDAEGIPAIVHYPTPLPRQEAFSEFKPAQCPRAEQLCAQVLSLPMHAALGGQDVQRVIDAVREFFRRPSGHNK